MKRHQVALIIALALLAAMASTSLVSGGFSPSIQQDTPLESTTFVTPGDDALVPALHAATLVVRARVEQVVSRWAADHSHLQSESTLAIRYTLRGAVAKSLVVHTIGGYLPEENLAMVDSEAPTLSAGEEVLLFLAPGVDGYTIVGRHDGKYIVHGSEVRYTGSHCVESLDTFYARLTRLAPDITLPQEWKALEAAVHDDLPVQAADFVYNERKWPNNNISFYVNLNSGKMAIGNGTADDFLAAILNSAMTWSMAEAADFTLTYLGATATAAPVYDHTNNVFFIDKGLVDGNGVRQPLATATVWFSAGVILDADIAVNDAYQWDATGQPDRVEIDLESVVLHEFGHWLSLGHDPDNRAVMYYAITAGTLKRQLFDNDRRGIEYIYPCAAGQVCNPTSTATPTATATPIATATPTVTPTATPTLTPITRIVTRDAGGIVEYAPAPGSTVTLLVPPNAVLTDTAITIEAVNEVPPLPPKHSPVTQYFRVSLGPTGMSHGNIGFQQPATLTVTHSPVAGNNGLSDSVRLLTVDQARQAWVEIACEYAVEGGDTQRVTTMIEQPSTYGLFRVENLLYLPLTQR